MAVLGGRRYCKGQSWEVGGIARGGIARGGIGRDDCITISFARYFIIAVSSV